MNTHLSTDSDSCFDRRWLRTHARRIAFIALCGSLFSCAAQLDDEQVDGTPAELTVDSNALEPAAELPASFYIRDGVVVDEQDEVANKKKKPVVAKPKPQPGEPKCYVCRQISAGSSTLVCFESPCTTLPAPY